MRQTCLRGVYTWAYLFVRFSLSGTFKTTRTSPVNNELKQQVTVPVKTSRTKKLRVARLGLSNTRPVRTNTADRAPNMSTRRIHVGVLVCKVCIEWNIQNNQYQPSEQRVETTGYGAGGNLKNEKITSCKTRAGQHAPRTQKHCRPCATHAHDTEVRARTCLHGLFSVEHSYQPGTRPVHIEL